MLRGCMGYQEVYTLPGWQKVYAPNRPQTLEVPKGRGVPERPSVQMGSSSPGILL